MKMAKKQNPATFGLPLTVKQTEQCGYPGDRTKEEEMQWWHLIWRYWLGTTKETDGVVDISSLTNGGQV